MAGVVRLSVPRLAFTVTFNEFGEHAIIGSVSRTE